MRLQKFRLLRPSVPQSLEVTEGDYYLDGGSIILTAKDHKDKPRKIFKFQHLTSPGWIYLDDWRVPFRGTHEEAILRCLEVWLETRSTLPDESTAPPAGEAIRMPGGGTRMYGSSDIARSMSLSRDDNLTWLVQELLSHAHSDSYGKQPPVERIRRL